MPDNNNQTSQNSAQPQPTPAVQPVQPTPAAQPAIQQPAATPATTPVTPVPPTTAGPVATAPAAQPAQPKPAPAAVPAPASTPVRPAPAAVRPGQPAQPGVRPGVTRRPPNPKKLLYGCGGCFSVGVFFFIIFVLFFVSQTTASGENPLARSLGLDPGSFINTLILLVNLIFGIVSVGLFLLATVGFFRLFMARKDDKEAKKRGLTLAGIAGLLLILFVGIWIGIYLFLSAKKVPTQRAPTSAIVTEPASTLGLTAPVEIKFDASNVPINRNTYDILSYLWNFGDGTSSTVVAPTHLYKDKGANNGRFDVTLQVTKRDKRSQVESVDPYTTIVTIANVELTASFSATPETGPAPLTVDFDASESVAPAGEITAYDWDFDNNNIFNDATGVTVSHEFPQVGTYKVNLRVTDNTGQFKAVSKDIIVSGANVPVAVIDIPTSTGKYYAGVQYSFLAEKSTSPNGSVEKFEWNFGDATPVANTRSANHIYKTPGNYEVVLKVTDETDVSGESSKKIKVETAESAPIASISTVPPPADQDDDFITGTMPFEVIFDGTKSQDPDNNIVDYKWDFDGDGSEDAAGSRVSYVYKTAGVFNATLTAIDAENNQSKAIVVVRVGAQPLQARITATPVEGVVPLTVTFDAGSSSYPGGQIVSYEWDFGDGGPKRIDVAQVVYKYTKIGTFTATVTAIASDNSRSTAQTPINVRPVPLTACFTPSSQQGTAPLTVEFDPNCSSGTIAKYSWDFGDTQTTKTRKPTHTFTTPGSYQVKLEVSDNQNVIDTFTKTILVTGTL